MARGSKGESIDTEIQDLLAGRRAPQARRLLELIHEVNPTGVDARGARERYALKSRLQSLLVKHFREELIVEPDARPAVAGLRHRSLAIDACHALIAELDDDARSWVQFQLDVGHADPAEPRPSKSRPVRANRGDEDALARARRQIDNFEYLEARETLEGALADGVADAAGELLRLLVDHLGADEDALRLEPSLGPTTEQRILLALAAARLRRAGQAESLLRPLVSGTANTIRAGEVYVLLARSALDEHDVDRATARLLSMREFDPAHPELVEIAREIDELKMRALEPVEARMREAWDAGDLAAAEQMARSTQVSPVARQILRELEARRRDERGKQLVERAERALEDGRLDAALRFAHEARAFGQETGPLEAKIGKARDARRARDVHAVLQAFESSLEAGLDAYADLDDETKELVKSARRREELTWMDEALQLASTTSAAVKAIVALARAAELKEEGAIEEAREAMVPHARVLERVRRARALVSEIDRELVGRNAAARVASLDEAEAALARDDIEEARRLLMQAGRGAKAHALRSALARREASVRDRALMTSLLEERKFVEALSALESVVAEDEQVRVWRERIDEGVRATLRVRRIDIGDDEDATLVGALAIDTVLGDEMRAWVHDGELVLLTSVGRWLFFAVYDLHRRKIRELVHLHAPDTLDSAHVYVDGERVLIVNANGALELARATWRVVRWRSLKDVIESGAIADDWDLTPGGRHVWIESRVVMGETTMCIVDVARGKLHRRLHAADHVVAVPGGGAPWMAALGYDSGARLHEGNGPLLGELVTAEDVQVHGLACAPRDASRLVAIISTPLNSSDDAEPRFEAAQLIRDGKAIRPVSAVTIAGVYDEMPEHLVTAREAGLSYYLFTSELGKELACLRCDGERIAIEWRVRAPENALLVQDCEAMRAWSISLTNKAELEVQALGASPPRFEAGASTERARLRLEPPFYCDAPRAGHWRLWDNARKLLFALTPEERVAKIEAMMSSEEPEIITAHLRALNILNQRLDADKLAARALEQRPGDADFSLYCANVAASCLEWAKVLALFEGVDLSALGPPGVKHAHHLIGAANLYLGNIDAARAAWQTAVDLAGDCDLSPCLELLTPPREWGYDQPHYRQLLGCIHASDVAALRGETAAALATLRRPAVLCGGELQTLARLTKAELSLDPRGEVDAFIKLVSLTTFVDAMERTREPGNLPVPGAMWGDEILEDLLERARARIEELAGDHEPACASIVSR